MFPFLNQTRRSTATRGPLAGRAAPVQQDEEAPPGPLYIDSPVVPKTVAPQPAPAPAAPAPSRLPWSHPTRKAERARQRARAHEGRAKRVAAYLSQGLDQSEAERRVGYDLYKESSR